MGKIQAHWPWIVKIAKNVPTDKRKFGESY